MKSITVITPPAGYPVTLSEAKSHCRVTGTAHDSRLEIYIAAATAAVQQSTGMVFVEQTLRVDVDGFPDGNLTLPIAPVQSVVSVKYDDSSDDEQTLVENTDYFVRLGGQYPVIAPVSNWPTPYEGKPGSVRVTVLAGYETASSPIVYGEDVPADLKHAILVKIKEFFDVGGETISGNNSVSPSVNTVDALIAGHRRWFLS